MKILTMLSRWMLAIRLWLCTSDEALFALPAPKDRRSARLALMPPLASRPEPQKAPPLRLVLKVIPDGGLEVAAANDEREPDNLVVLRTSRMALGATARKARAVRTAREASGQGARVYSIDVFRRLNQHKQSDTPKLA